MRRVLTGAICAATLGFAVAPAQAAFDDPLVFYTPQPADLKPVPPAGHLEGPCGLAVSASGSLYLSDYYHRAVDVFNFEPSPSYEKQPLTAWGGGPNPHTGPVDDPCGLALDSSGDLYLNDYHRQVVRFPAPTSLAAAQLIDSGDPTDPYANPTGVAVNPETDHVYVDDRNYVAEYDASGLLVRKLGEGSLGDGYGIAVSGFPATAGYVYVPDAESDIVRVFDSTGNAKPSITGPEMGFHSLRDSAVAVDDATGEVYVADTFGPQLTEEPWAIVYVFASNGAYEGRLKHATIDAAPVGLAVDNSGTSTQSRVYVTSGITENASVYEYPPGAATSAGAQPLTSTASNGGVGSVSPTIPIGGEAASEPSPEITCVGDACQVLPPMPADPTLTTLLEGLGNPRPRYRDTTRACGRLAQRAHQLSQLAHRLSRRAQKSGPHTARDLHARAARLARRSHRVGRAAEDCFSGNGARLSRYSARAGPTVSSVGPVSDQSHVPIAVSREAPRDAAALLPGPAGLSAHVWPDGGGTVIQAGSHPYEVSISLGLDQGGGSADLRDLEVGLPTGLLADLLAVDQCSSVAFHNARSSPFETSNSGENCPDSSQVGTIEVRGGAGGGQTQRFGLFNLAPQGGAPAQLGAAPFGTPIVFNEGLGLESGGASAQALSVVIPQSLALHDLTLTLWGIPWAASHDGERGDCLNEAVEPGLPWAKCSVAGHQPRAYLTLPTDCREALAFSVRLDTWQELEPISTEARNEAEGRPVPVSDCESLAFQPEAEAYLTTTKASTPSGFNFRLKSEVQRGLLDPRSRIDSYPSRAEVQLPPGTMLNAALAAGLAVCRPDRLGAETAFTPFGDGCPAESRIGEFTVSTPLYSGVLHGTIFLAEPDDRSTEERGAENPYDSVLAFYLVAKSAQRGILVRLAGEVLPDPATGNVTAVVEKLPQFPYTDLDMTFDSGQRAPLITPPRCGDASTHTTLTPSDGGPAVNFAVASQLKTGPGDGPCPDGSVPPFAPEVTAGGVNSNVGSYTPYYVDLRRHDSEQQITSYSLVLPKGISGKLAGIPFCSDEAITRARAAGGFEELREPSCPATSRIGHTLTGYSAGSALDYVSGNVYLAGPYHGSPLSLVTVNPAVVGFFDLGTIVIRSAFDVDPRTAQLRIDSRASDPIPSVIDGFPLFIRDARIYMDRAEFTHNPTSCEASRLVSTLTGSGASLGDPTDDSTAIVGERFQLLNCLTLGFRPTLGLFLRGGSRRGDFPSLHATFTSRGAKDANLKRIEVLMPHSEFLAQNHIRTVCTRPQFEAEQCPASSAYGRAVADTPLFDAPLRGNVYLRSSSRRLPDLVADLHSGSIRIVVEGRIGPTKRGGVRVFFDDLPDAPINRFAMRLFGGRRGLLVNSNNVCNSPPLVSVKALGQNNVGSTFSSPLRGQCRSGSGRQREHHTNPRREHR